MSGKKPSRPARRTAADPLLTPSAQLTEAAALLAFAAPPVAPPPQVKANLLARIRAQRGEGPASTTPAGWHFESADVAEGWRATVFPGVRFKTLSVDESRDVAMVLVEMAPGSRFPDHQHDQGGDEGIVISGDVINAGRLMRAGDYYRAEEGTAHTGTMSPTGCVALISLTARAWRTWHAMAQP